jgi:hypothetical protein
LASFSDQENIPKWADFSIKMLNSKGIINGNLDGSFKPNKTINRAEFCKMLITATGVGNYVPITASFLDVEDQDWFFTPVETAKHYGWINGYEDGTFRPGNKINQAEIAKILSLAFKLPVNENIAGHWYTKYVKTLEKYEALPHEKSFNSFIGAEYPGRALVADQIYRLMIRLGKISSYEITDFALKIEETKSREILEKKKINKIEIIDEIKNETTISSMAKLYVSKEKSAIKKMTVSQNQESIEALTINLKAEQDNLLINKISIRRIGNGKFADFSNIWILSDGKNISDKIILDNDLVSIKLNHPLYVNKDSKKTISIMVDIAKNATKNSSSRFVLFKPEWINSNNKAKIGFFPIGGIDLEIK